MQNFWDTRKRIDIAILPVEEHINKFFKIQECLRDQSSYWIYQESKQSAEQAQSPWNIY